MLQVLSCTTSSIANCSKSHWPKRGVWAWILSFSQALQGAHGGNKVQLHVARELCSAKFNCMSRESYAPHFGDRCRYPPVTKCKQLDVCDVEVFVYAETMWQTQNSKLWARQIWKQIAEGGVTYQLELNNLIIAVVNVEPMYISPDTVVVESCPSAPMVCTLKVDRRDAPKARCLPGLQAGPSVRILVADSPRESCSGAS